MKLSLHCNSTTGHIRIGRFCMAWRNAVPRHSPIFANGYERLYDCFGETNFSWGDRSLLLH